jgi:hypothetical protein
LARYRIHAESVIADSERLPEVRKALNSSREE